MGKKGAKRKTRWRTLSIGTPPGEEDEEDGLKNGFLKGQENGTNSRTFDRNGQTGYRPRKMGSGTTTSGYTSASSKSRRDDSTGSPSQPKIIFNEEEYTRITTPRQDVLFKKGYLSQKKPWTSTASTSATPSTTESQSASHSTADGSETTEDQQLLDSGAGEYSSVIEPAAQLGYGTFYDHASGYYYEYPVMLVGPPMPEQMEPNCLAAMSCGPVPLRPIEWVNPAFVPKLDGQQFCYTDYQSAQSVDCAAMVDAQGMMMTAENSNMNGDESYAGSASCSGSIAGEDTLEQTEENTEDLPVNEVQDGYNGGQYIEPTLVPPMHITPVVQPLPQPYMYPGHYMFGPSLVNVNGVTIQSGPMVRYNDVMAPTTPMTCAKWRRKKRKRKQKRPPVPGNTEDEEEEEYSSDWENGSTRQPWTESSSTTTTTATTTVTTTTRPLNPECQEFQLRSMVESETTKVESTALENSLMETNSNPPSVEISTLQQLNRDSLDSEGKATVSTTNMLNDCPLNGDDSKRLTESSSGFPKEPSANETDGGTTEPRGTSNKEAPIIHDSSNPKSSNHISQNLHNSHNSSVQISNIQNQSNSQNPSIIENSPIVQNSPSKKLSSLQKSSKNSKLSGVQKSSNGKKSSTGQKSKKSSTGQNSANSQNSVNSSLVENTNVENTSIDEKSSNDENLLNDKNLSTDQNSSSARKSSIEDNHDEREQIKEILNLKVRINGIKTTKTVVATETNIQDEKRCSRPASPEINRTITPINAETQRLPESYESLVTRPVVPPRRKYSSKSAKFVREPTPGPDFTTEINSEFEKGESIKKIEENQMHNGSLENSQPSCERLIADQLNNESSESQIETKFEELKLEERGDNLENRVKFNDEKLEDQENGKVNRPITEAVTEWLRKADSTDLFVTTGLETETESEEDDENLTRKPPKNLQGNPIPALSSNGCVNNELLMRLTNCGEFARINKRIREQLKSLENSSVLRRKRSTRNKRKMENKKQMNKKADYNGNIKIDSVKDNLIFVGDCDFTKEDSVAGVRVASNSRMSEEVKILHCPAEDPTIVRTFEKGEIVVSIDGKLLPDTKFHYEPMLGKFGANENEQTERFEKDKTNLVNCNDKVKITEKGEIETKLEKRDETEETELPSIGSIEEPDVLDCWEAEILEPIVSPKKQNSDDNSRDGDILENDLDPGVEHVKRYYRLVRGSVTSGTSVEDEKSEKTNSGNVPNSPESLQSEEIPCFMSKKKMPIDEAFEVYESCYNGNQYITLDPRFRRQKLGHEDGPIPCKAVCCNIQ